MKPLPKSYDPKEAEPRWQKAWEERGVYAWKDDQKREDSFVIDTPPPTVSGVLHMGHIFSYTQADFVARYQRMSGKDVFYPMGFDDNGLPTERLVEKIKNRKASQYESREAFVRDCREVVQSAEEEFRALFKSVALSVDWKQEYQTISPEVRRLSQQSFVELLAKGEAYRDFRPTYWDWVDQTAIAQAEIENKELPGVMNEILFRLEDESPLHIATTRPELLGACVAVMYHPEDPNAADYKDKYAITPLFGVKVPMIADGAVERDKGTGLVMCCTFGDDTDKEWWRKYKLPTRTILGTDGKVNVITDDGIHFLAGRDGKKYHSTVDVTNCADLVMAIAAFQAIKGFKPKQANAKMLEMLKEEDTLLKQTNITHTVKCAERSGTPIEIIPTYQWFVKITDKKEPLKEKGRECKWYPEFMRLRLEQWIDGLKEDWCVSRQRFFGVPFPIWYSKRAGEEGKVIVADVSQLPVDPLVDLPRGYKKEEVDGDKDVMDTWATSSLSPQISAGSLTPTLSRGEREKKASAKEPSPSGRGLGEGGAKKLPLPSKFLQRARELRKNSTDAEQFLWSVLRDSQLAGFKFRRQHPITPYAVDFFCHEADLIIELDGGQHSEESNRQKDEQRTHFLEGKGFRVLRFWNNEVLENMEGVFQTISDALALNAPHPAPLPEGEGNAASRYSKLFPADLRPQAHEIIRTWAFYTIVKAHLHTNTIPWKNLMISGWCLAADKTKMSKSKGNVITPVELIRDKGADAVRYWASTSRLGADTAFSEDLLKIGKKLVTKLWNATSFAAIHLGKLSGKPGTAAEDMKSGKITETLDKWILSRLAKTIEKATLEFERFEYCDARVAVEEFFWKDFCDNYLELVKARAYGENSPHPDPLPEGEGKEKPSPLGRGQAHRSFSEGGLGEGQQSAVLTLYHCLNTILRLFAPFAPHITEELYSHLFSEQSVHARGNWPKTEDYITDEASETAGKECVEVLEVIRATKSERKVSIKTPLKLLILSSKKEDTAYRNIIENVIEDLKSAANAEAYEWRDDFQDALPTVSGHLRVGFDWGEKADVA